MDLYCAIKYGFLIKETFINIFLIIFILPILCQTEYKIKDGIIPSYLHTIFRNIQDDIFPGDLMINISLSSFEGILWYSIDNNMNQFIITLHEDSEPALQIELRGGSKLINVSKLCKCSKCKYKPLLFHILIKDMIYINCNDGLYHSLSYGSNKYINPVYPIIKNDKNQTHVWMVNIFLEGSLHYSDKQLTGCIHGVFYKNKLIKMEKYGNGITDQCKKTCTKTICNDGECHELYDSIPLCDCSKSFRNGDFCNLTVPFTSTGHNLVHWQFKFKIIKISWCSNSKLIFVLENHDVLISIYGTINLLYLKYKNKNIENHTTTNHLQYVANKNSLMILKFEKNLIYFEFLNDGKLSKGSNIVDKDLSEEIFNILILLNESGTIDLVFKIHSNKYKWQSLNVIQYDLEINTTTEVLMKNRNSEIQNEFTNFTIQHGYKIALPVILVILIIIIFTLRVCICIKKKRKRRLRAPVKPAENQKFYRSNIVHPEIEILQKKIKKNKNLQNKDKVFIPNSEELNNIPLTVIVKSDQ